MQYRTCPRCRQTKPGTDFQRCSSSRDGLQTYCKVCKEERRQEVLANGPIRPVTTKPPFPVIEGVVFANIPSLDGYAASTDGRIWCCKKLGKVGGYDTRWRQKTQGKINSGYWVIAVRNIPGSRRVIHLLVHRLVLEAFVGPCPVGMEGMHRDHNRNNCELSNLQYGTHRENVWHSITTGVSVCKPGEGNGSAKLKDADVREIRRLRTCGLLQREIADQFGISRTTVVHILQRKRWSHVV